jgi:hypothetical protein
VTRANFLITNLIIGSLNSFGFYGNAEAPSSLDPTKLFASEPIQSSDLRSKPAQQARKARTMPGSLHATKRKRGDQGVDPKHYTEVLGKASNKTIYWW